MIRSKDEKLITSDHWKVFDQLKKDRVYLIKFYEDLLDQYSNLYISSTILIGFSYLYLNIYFSLLIVGLITILGIFLDKKIAYSFLLASSELKN